MLMLIVYLLVVQVTCSLPSDILMYSDTSVDQLLMYESIKLGHLEIIWKGMNDIYFNFYML